MRVTVLGTGTSYGVPMIGCRCEVCTSSDPHDQRLRCSVHIEFESQLACLIDTSLDLRQQALTHDLRRCDAVFYTHTHSDHVNGLDELRSFNHLQGSPIVCHGKADHLADIRARYEHCFRPPQQDTTVPAISLHPVEGSFVWHGIHVTPLPIKHGVLDIVGWRFDDFAYITDASEVPESTVKLMEGVDVLILNALRQTPHPTHMSLGEACEVAERIGAQQTWFTHICHEMKHAETNANLPPTMQLAYDGLTFEV